MITETNAVVHIKRSFAVALLVLVMFAALCQRHLEAMLFTSLSIWEHMQDGCSAREVYDLLGVMQCFPVAEDQACDFENGYGDGRTYGGQRRHEGIDVMSRSGKRGELTVQSVSEGVVEKIGWLPLGGYRVGIRSPQGYYFYYAHLEKYAPGLKKGQKVHAGQTLGLMGDTGYGKEGTRGKFPVHLHFGIYRRNNGSDESLNPYFLLKYL